MALTMEQLKNLMKQEKLRFFLDPDNPRIMFGATGLNGSYQLVISLENNGEFLQFRTLRFLFCPEDHPNVTEVLKVLGAENFRRRLVKFGWDANDGEIVAYADIWLQDNTVTQNQFSRMMSNYLPVVDMAHLRIRKAMETGQDPGDAEPDLSALLSSLPPELRELAEKLKRAKDGEKPEDSEISAL
jgi:hypothetical protein